jgi:hypothetical protein
VEDTPVWLLEQFIGADECPGTALVRLRDVSPKVMGEAHISPKEGRSGEATSGYLREVWL